MDSWSQILKQYFKCATNLAIIKELWKRSNTITKLGISGLTIIVMLAGVILYFTDRNWIALTMLAACEVIFLLIINGIKERLIRSHYLEQEDNTASRYELFRESLQNHNISKRHVKDCFDLIEIKSLIAQKNNTNLKRAVSYILGLFAGFITAMAKNINPHDFIPVLFIFGVIGYFFIGLSSIIPTREEKLLELNYFMKLFCADPRNK